MTDDYCYYLELEKQEKQRYLISQSPNS